MNMCEYDYGCEDSIVSIIIYVQYFEIGFTIRPLHKYTRPGLFAGAGYFLIDTVGNTQNLTAQTS